MKSAAVVTKVAGKVFVHRSGQEIALEVGAEIFVTDALRTEADSKLELRFRDNSELDLGPSTQVNVSDFAFDEAGVPPAFGIHVLQGLARTASGKVVEQNPEGFTLSTPFGNAGIRGTVLWASVSEKQVVFTVTELGQGHTVVITTADGRSVIIHLPETGVIITEGDSAPLNIFEMTPEQFQDYLRNVFQEDLASNAPQGFYVYADAEFLASLGQTGLTSGLVRFGEVETLVGALEKMGVDRGVINTGLGTLLPGSDGASGGASGGASPVVFPSVSLPGSASADTLIGAPNQNHTITAAAGNDFIVVYNGTDMVEGGHGSRDFIVKMGNMEAGSELFGDIRVMSGATADHDYILVRGEGLDSDIALVTETQGFGVITMSGGEIYGDGHSLTNVDARTGTGGSDIVGQSNEATLPTLPTGDVIRIIGFMTGGTIYGDAYSIVATSSYSDSGADTISIEQGLDANGNTVGGTMSGGTIYGDAYIGTSESPSSDFHFGNDTITMSLLTGTGSVYGDAYTVSAGNGAFGGSDTFNITTMSGGTIYGDLHSFVSTQYGGQIKAYFGGDTFNITTMSGGTIYGDAHTVIGWDFLSNNMGAADTITIGNMSGGTIYGDAYLLKMEGTTGFSQFNMVGNDITITQGMTGGTIYGNAYEFSLTGLHIPDFSNAVADEITITGNVTNATIYGDAHAITELSFGSNVGTKFMADTIKITGDVTNTTIYGDAHTITELSFAGNVETTFMADTITVNGTLGAGGVIYGDTHSGLVGTLSGTNDDLDSIGKDTITVDALDKGKIFSGFGNDTVTLGHVKTGLVDLGTGSDTLTLNGMEHNGTLYLDFGDDDFADTLNLTVWTGSGNVATIHLYNYTSGIDKIEGSGWTLASSDADSAIYTGDWGTLTVMFEQGTLDAGIAL